MALQAPAKDTERYFEEITDGEQYAVEDKRTITETDVVNFAGLSGDFSEWHMSKEHMESTEFGERIAHGLLVMAIVDGLVDDLNPKAITYGYEEVRFPTATKIGDTLSARREVVETTDYNETYGRVDYRYEAENQNGDVVFSSKHITLVEKQGGE